VRHQIRASHGHTVEALARTADGDTGSRRMHVGAWQRPSQDQAEGCVARMRTHCRVYHRALAHRRAHPGSVNGSTSTSTSTTNAATRTTARARGLVVQRAHIHDRGRSLSLIITPHIHCTAQGHWSSVSEWHMVQVEASRRVDWSPDAGPPPVYKRPKGKGRKWPDAGWTASEE
jgi:hypothetical protein